MSGESGKGQRQSKTLRDFEAFWSGAKPSGLRLSFAVLGAFSLLARPASALEVPFGFIADTLVTGLNAATAIAPASDGRIFIADQTGRLRTVCGIGRADRRRTRAATEYLAGKNSAVEPDGSIPEDNPFFSKAQGKYRGI